MSMFTKRFIGKGIFNGPSAFTDKIQASYSLTLMGNGNLVNQLV